MRSHWLLLLSVGLIGVVPACKSAKDPTLCTDITCKPPTCCGGSCATSADCCAETICSTSGRCIPESCAACTDTGCVVDYEACTGRCAPPASCREICSTDADCAAGTACRASTTGELRCFPKACDGCWGMESICRVQEDCSTECHTPEACGRTCSTSEDCDASTLCKLFTSTGNSYCVPTAFESTCGECSYGCTFSPSKCTVTCQTSPTGGVDAGVGPGPDAGTSGAADAGTTDAGTTAPVQPACAPCCDPCAIDSDCCPGSTCGESQGRSLCVPMECGGCTYGCTFHCP